MEITLFTGFPGFLGSALLPRILNRTSGQALCLVQDRFAELARRRVEALERGDSALRGRILLRTGDITRPELGTEWGASTLGRIRSIFHLAAVYDLSVDASTARAVNVTGTRNVLDLARRVPDLDRLHYVSTCYVSGTHKGLFLETDLERDQDFHNPYESTKYEAEVEVRRAMEGGIPATIYRPSVVVGDSRTGETQKLDGPYFVIQWILRQRGLALMPVVGNPTLHTLNVVPRDYVVDAMEFLSSAEIPPGLTFHLADPDPVTNAELIRAIGRTVGTRILQIPLPARVAKGALAHVPGLSRFMGIPPATVDYFTHPTEYDTSQAREYLAPAGIQPPSLLEYLPRLVDFVRAHPEIPSQAMT